MPDADGAAALRPPAGVRSRTAPETAPPSRARRLLAAALRRLAGLALVAGSALLLAALGSFEEADPTRLVHGDGPVANLLGVPGAWAAAEFRNWLGVPATWAAALAPAAWGSLLVLGRRVGRFGLRLPALVLAAFAFAHLEALLVDRPAAGLTALAALVLDGLRGLVPAFGATPGFASAAFAAFGLVGLAAWLYAACIPAPRPGRVLRPVLAGVLYLFRRWFRPRNPAAIAAEIRARRVKVREAAAPEPPAPPRRGAGAPETPDDPPPAGGRAKREKEIVLPRAPRVGRREARERQLDLGPEISGGGFRLPALSLLREPPPPPPEAAAEGREANARMLESVLNEFRVQGEVTRVVAGPVVTRYEFEPAPGTRSNRVIALSGDIARSMSAMSARVALVPGRNVLGIELPNPERAPVLLRELLAAEAFEKATGPLPVALGKDIAGEPVVADLSRMPHLLIAGTTGSGKSVGVNAMILSLLYRLPPEQARLVLIDPKMLELSVYEGIPHLLHPVVTDPKKAVAALRWAVREMNERYRTMSLLGVRGINAYNQRAAESLAKGKTLSRTVQTGFDPETGRPVYEEQEVEARPFPYVVIVVDEMADLVLSAGKEFELAVQALSQKARAAGIHLIVATQRPSVDVITGTIKANLPCRISFQVSSGTDSRTVLGEQGAEQLLGKGDMLFMETGGPPRRLHGPFVSDEEVEKVAAFLRAQGEPEYVHQITEETDSGAAPEEGADGRDPLFADAVALVVREGRASTSFLQRHLQVGYNRAARIIEQMEEDGVVSAANHVGKREVLADVGGA